MEGTVPLSPHLSLCKLRGKKKAKKKERDEEGDGKNKKNSFHASLKWKLLWSFIRSYLETLFNVNLRSINFRTLGCCIPRSLCSVLAILRTILKTNACKTITTVNPLLWIFRFSYVKCTLSYFIYMTTFRFLGIISIATQCTTFHYGNTFFDEG